MSITDLIIFSGQSNMQGQTESIPENNEPIANAMEYRYLGDTLVPLRHPVGEHLNVRGNSEAVDYSNCPDAIEKCALLGAWFSHSCMVPSFCKNYIAETGHNAVAVHAAKGSTTIDDWLPGTDSYSMLVRKASAASCKLQINRKYFVWLQGESDALRSCSTMEYVEKLTLLKQALRIDLGIEKFGIILVGEFTKDARDLQIMNAQRIACETDNDFLMLTTATEEMVHQKEYMNPNCGGHFGTRGQERLGELAGKTLGQFEISFAK